MKRSTSTELSPKKLLHTKWTAVEPRNKEKHFLVTRVIEPEPPGSPVVAVEIEAVHSNRSSGGSSPTSRGGGGGGCSGPME